MNLPRQVSEIPKLDENGFTRDGRLLFIPQKGSSIINMFQCIRPHNMITRYFVGTIDLDRVYI